MACCCGCWIPEEASSPKGDTTAFGGPRECDPGLGGAYGGLQRAGLDYWGVVCKGRRTEVWPQCPSFSTGLDSWDALTTGQTFLWRDDRLCKSPPRVPFAL